MRRTCSRWRRPTIRSQSRHSVLTGSDEPLGVRVRLRRSHRRVDRAGLRAEQLVEGSGELAVAIVDQETHPLKDVGETEVARLLNHPGAGRVRRAPGEVDRPAAELDEEEHVEAAQRDRLDGEEVAGEQARPPAGAETPASSPSGAVGAGSSPAEARRRRTVLGEIGKSSLISSPAIR